MKRIACFMLAWGLLTASAQAQTNGSAPVGFVSNPCTSSNTISNVAINISTAVTTQLVALSGSTRIYVCKVVIIEAGTTNVTLETGTGALCATNTTALTGPMPLSWVEPSGVAPNYVSAVGYALCLVNSQAIQVSGSIEYVQQ